MKKVFILLVLSITLFSCRNTSINGRLDGMWQLMIIEKNGEAGIDVAKGGIYYNVKLHLMFLQQKNNHNYLGRFIQTDDSLFVYDFLQNKNNSIKATVEDLVPFGIYNTYERFGIEKMTKKQMVLKSQNAILTFRKF